MNVQVPIGSIGEVHIPHELFKEKKMRIVESGIRLHASAARLPDGVQHVEVSNGATVIFVAHGRYSFTASAV